MSEKFTDTEVICGVYDKDLANTDEVLAHTAEQHEGDLSLGCCLYYPPSD